MHRALLDRDWAPEPPDVPPAESLTGADACAISDRASIEEARVHAPPGGARIGASGFVCSCSTLSGEGFAGCRLPSSRLIDTRLERIDLVGASLAGARLVRVLCVEARLSGIDLRGAQLRDVVVRGGRMPDACLAESELRGVLLEDVDAPALDLTAARIARLVIRSSRVRGLALAGARIECLDLRGSEIDGIGIEPGAVRSIVIDPPQAPALAQALGATLDQE
ncbi:MAG: pentapeptide repeat-containing protein [Planctomycetota bacterium]